MIALSKRRAKRLSSLLGAKFANWPRSDIANPDGESGSAASMQCKHATFDAAASEREIDDRTEAGLFNASGGSMKSFG